jgi:hypothetical protein
MDQTTAQVVIGSLMAYILQWLKQAPWFPILTEQSAKWWKVAVSAVVAALTAAGIDYSWEAASGTLILTGMTFDHVWNALIAFGVSFLSQHAAYEALINKGDTA